MIDCISANDQGICNAECCRNVVIPFHQVFYYGFQGHRYREPESEFRMGEVITPYREDTTCLFLDQDNRCGIYEMRPQVCELYGVKSGCFHFNEEGKPLTRAQKKRKERNGDFETGEDMKVQFHLMRQLWEKRKATGMSDVEIISQNDESMELYAKLKSLATPIKAINMLQKMRPDMVKEVDEL